MRTLILVGAGTGTFCAGADISELSNDVELSRRHVAYRQGVVQRLANYPVPVIAVVDGMAAGGGAELALACSFRLATRQARFALPEIKLGLIPGCGGTQRLPRLIGENRALEMLLTGRIVEAEEALRIGLVDKLVERPVEDAKAFAQHWTAHSLVATRAIMAAVRCAQLPIEQGLAEEASQLAIADASEDATEGKTAFLQKRAAVFRDR